MRAPDKPTIRRSPGRPRGRVDSVVGTLRDLNDPTKVLALMARVVMERERYYGRPVIIDKALAEARVWFKRRYGAGIPRVKFEARANAAGFIVRKTRKKQPIQTPDLEGAREMLRCPRTW